LYKLGGFKGKTFILAQQIHIKMRSLILHANKFQTKVIKVSNRPKGIKPENKKSHSENMKDCLIIFFCVEEEDSIKQLNKLHKEILKTADEVNTKNIMISPFVHLSQNIAKPSVAKKLYEKLLDKFKKSDFVVKSSHFGYHKSLLLDIKGHPGSFRYREFY
jgi:threonyl-tRNA synthetase